MIATDAPPAPVVECIGFHGSYTDKRDAAPTTEPVVVTLPREMAAKLMQLFGDWQWTTRCPEAYTVIRIDMNGSPVFILIPEPK